MKLIIIISTIFLVAYTAAASDCLFREYGENKKVCVCNSEHCDYYSVDITPDKINVVTSTQAGSRYRKNIQDIQTVANSENLIKIDRNRTYQKIQGFGGAFSDAAAINIMSLPSGAVDQLMRSYFGEMGSLYNLCRVPMACTDFSLRTYSYDDGPEDKNLTNFKLAEEDLNFKIPLMKAALELSSGKTNLKFFSSPWAAPKWMKENDDYLGGYIKKEHYQTWANYFVKFFEEYKKKGIPFWGLTTANEATFDEHTGKIPSIKWIPQELGLWIRDNFGPTLRSSEFSDVRLLALDDQRTKMGIYLDSVLENEETRSYVDGIAVHWYKDKTASPTILTSVHERFPEQFVLYTEACNGFGDATIKVDLGSWERGENYVDDIIENLNHWVTGWVDWNLALNTEGGPSNNGNSVDAAIIVNATAGEFYKQPMYYAIGHFSKFVPEDSLRIQTYSNTDLSTVAFVRPDKKIVLVILNKNDQNISVSVQDGSKYINLQLEERSIITVIY